MSAPLDITSAMSKGGHSESERMMADSHPRAGHNTNRLPRPCSEISLQQAQEEKQRRKDLFGDCALIEIIHLHDCLRGALRELQQEVSLLSQSVLGGTPGPSIDLERRVNGRFKVIWSVFRAHSEAEDEFIWPALKKKTGGVSPLLVAKKEEQQRQLEQQPVIPINPNGANEVVGRVQHEERGGGRREAGATAPSVVEQDEYVEDHADEERMFNEMDELLSRLRDSLGRQVQQETDSSGAGSPLGAASVAGDNMILIAKAINDLTSNLMCHLMEHLKKEETQCMPLVIKYLNKQEIHDLVGQIMGKRSCHTIAQIMSMAVQNLEPSEREEMVQYMKQAMVGTFFERWLAMTGWMSSKKSSPSSSEGSESKQDCTDERKQPASRNGPNPADSKPLEEDQLKRQHISVETDIESKRARSDNGNSARAQCNSSPNPRGITSQAELEKMIRVIASNPALSPVSKNTTIQGLRDSVWKSNLKHQQSASITASAPAPTVLDCGGDQASVLICPEVPKNTTALQHSVRGVPTSHTIKRETPPSSYYRKTREGTIELVWSRESSSLDPSLTSINVPLFSSSELAPTYHDGATGAFLGCPHYARGCKLRHPSSGRLYTCRLCCEQDRENPLKEQDSPLDRYAVTELYCMSCGALQPAGLDHCINPECKARFSKYHCKLCNLFDDGPSKDIYHCPFCNVCRSGKGLGIDYRHCMRCNACVSLKDTEHRCINQKLQGSCPICHESLFQSIAPLRGLKCGHVLHMKCYVMFRRSQSYTCPLCKKSVEDMKEYFAMLDAAVRMQPMPAAYTLTMSNIYCQDCDATGKIPYHFVGLKCPTCGSYNTRELGRQQVAPTI